jgi:hypothetical protein
MNVLVSAECATTLPNGVKKTPRFDSGWFEEG